MPNIRKTTRNEHKYNHKPITERLTETNNKSKQNAENRYTCPHSNMVKTCKIKKAVATLSNQCDNYHKLANRHRTVGIPYPAPITVMFDNKHDCYFFLFYIDYKNLPKCTKKKG